MVRLKKTKKEIISKARDLAVAHEEVGAFSEYDFIVVNDELTSAVDRLRGIVLAERARLMRMSHTAEDIARTFP